MIERASTPEQIATLVGYLASKVGTTPQQLVGQTPFEILAIHRMGKPVGAVLFANYRGTSIEMSWAGEPGWLTRGNLRDIFGYPFHQLGCLRVWGLVRKTNKASRNLAAQLGCTEIGVAEHEYGLNDHAIIYSITRDNCRWIIPPQRAIAVAA